MSFTGTERLPDFTHLLCTLFAQSFTLLCHQFREMEMFSYDHSSTFLHSRVHRDYIMCTCLLATPNEQANSRTMLERLILHLSGTT